MLAPAVMDPAAAIDPTRVCHVPSASSESSARAIDEITALTPELPSEAPDLAQQIDRWADEGGAIPPLPMPRSRPRPGGSSS